MKCLQISSLSTEGQLGDCERSLRNDVIFKSTLDHVARKSERLENAVANPNEWCMCINVYVYERDQLSSSSQSVYCKTNEEKTEHRLLKRKMRSAPQKYAAADAQSAETHPAIPGPCCLLCRWA